MSKISFTPDASGTGVFTIASPNSNTDRTLTLPDSSGDFVLSASGVISDFESTGIDDNATSTAITIDSSENVGIGTSSPKTTLDVVAANTLGSSMTGTTVGQGVRVSQSSYTASNYVSLIEGTYIENGSGADVRIAAMYDGGGSNLSFGVTNSYGQINNEAMFIDSSGNLLVGKTSTSFGTDGALIQPSGVVSASRSDGPPAVFNRNNSNGDVVLYRRANNTVGSVSCTVTATSYNTSSDYRLKENVVDLDNGIDRLKQIPVHRFNFIADPDTTVDGFLAHEVQDVIPEAITGAKDAVDDEGNPEYQGIDQSKLVPLLTAALQEAVAKIEDLESRLSALETN